MLRIIVFILFMSYNVKAQENPVLDVEAIKAYAIQDSLRKDSLKTRFLNTKWDTTNFNPFMNEKPEFPFILEFDDVFFASPVPEKKVITSRYGWRWGRAHKGLDIDLFTGDDVMAMLEGKVRYVGYHSGHGKTVIIRHHNGLETVYAHLSTYKVKVNDTVAKGQIIGKGGRTGNARGSHVHLETMYKGQYINPEYLFSFDEELKIKKSTFWITEDWVTPYLHNSRRPSEFVYFDSEEEAENYNGLSQKTHIVRRGDTLYDISKTYNVPISKICLANALQKSSTLRIGQELVLGY